MSHVLIVESSARQQDSISRQLTRDFTAQWRAAHPTDQITVRDVAANPVPHLDADLLGGWMNPQDQRNTAPSPGALQPADRRIAGSRCAGAGGAHV